MNVKTYRGKEMTAVLAQIKEELGEEVEILSTQQIGRHEIQVRVAATLSAGSDAGVHGASSPQLQRREIEKGAPEITDRHIEQSLRASDRGASEGLTKTHEQLREVLRRQGFHPEYIQQLLTAAIGTAPTIDKLAGQGLEKLLQFEPSLPLGKRVVALVGATGVGKTTTVAKLAANMKIAFDMNVGLVSADSYRVGAGQHLQTYAELLDIPFCAVEDAFPLSEGIYRAVKSLGRTDLVLIDTAGYSPRDNERIRVLGSALSQLHWCEKMLVLPAPGNDVDLRTAARSFSPLGCSRIIVSKTDETGYMGPIVNTLMSLGKPIAFFTTGQRVPEDIEPASSVRLGWMTTRTLH